jgi:hypothetical protein
MRRLILIVVLSVAGTFAVHKLLEPIGLARLRASVAADRPFAQAGQNSSSNSPATTKSQTNWNSSAAMEGKTVQATDHSCKIKIPLGWNSMNPNMVSKDAVILAANPETSECFMVIADPKDWANVDRYGNDVSLAMAARIQDSNRSEPVHIQIGGRPAVRYVVDGVYHARDAVFSLTCVDGNNSGYQLCGWTFKAQRATSMPRLEQISETWIEGN